MIHKVTVTEIHIRTIHVSSQDMSEDEIAEDALNGADSVIFDQTEYSHIETDGISVEKISE